MPNIRVLSFLSNSVFSCVPYFSRDKPYHGLLGSVCISLKVGFIRVRESTGGSIKIRQEKSGSIFFCITLNIKCKEL